MGFRVAATNLPVHHVEAPVAPVAAAAPVEVPANDPVVDAYTAQPQEILTPSVQYSYLPYAQSYGYYGAASPVVQAAAPVVQAAAPVVQAAAPVVQVAPVVQAAAPVVPIAAAAEGSQYHAQDDFGQYSFGYSDGNSVKQEVKTADGVIRGAYSYVDSDGIVQTVNYIADALGFRVGATNLPVHHVDAEPAAAVAPVAVETPEAVAAPVVVASEQKAAPVTYSAQQSVISPAVNYAYLPYATNYGYSAPVSPVIAGATSTPIDVTNSQYHAQDDIEQYNYGYSSPLSTKQELKTADGVTRGSYSYVDANGLVQTVNYLSDAMGFRVAATNLPVHHVEAPVAPVAAAAPVEVPANDAVVDSYTAQPQEILTPSVQYSYLPYAQSYGYYGAASPSVQVKTATAPVVQAAAPVVQATVPVVQSAAPVVQSAAPVVQGVPVVQAAAPVVPIAAAAEGSQYHAQDDFGQYSFGYSDGNSVKQEVKTADGVIRGAYSYVDSDGIVQTVNYIADALGFRVGATNLPVHHVDAEPAAAVAPVAVETPEAVATPLVQAYHPYASSYAYAAPVVQAAAPVVQAATPVVPVVPGNVDVANSQYHAQDDFKQYNYGYSNPLSTKQELKTADGVTRGSYSYVDANGLVQTVNYLSDAMGFRVAATNLPVHHVEAPVVKAAEEVAKPVMAPSVSYAYLPYATNYGYNVASPAA